MDMKEALEKSGMPLDIPGAHGPDDEFLNQNYRAIVFLPIEDEQAKSLAYELGGKAEIPVGVFQVDPKLVDDQLRYSFTVHVNFGDAPIESRSETWEDPADALIAGIKWAKSFAKFEDIPRVKYLMGVDLESDEFVVGGDVS
jgi:hypothetical protein